MRNAKCEMRNAKCEMRNAKCEMRNAKCEMRNAYETSKGAPGQVPLTRALKTQ